jgi:hypothetical protein
LTLDGATADCFFFFIFEEGPFFVRGELTFVARSLNTEEYPEEEGFEVWYL